MITEDTTFPQQVVLNCLFKGGTLTAEEIADHLDWDEYKTTTTLLELVDQELVEERQIRKYIVNVVEDHTGLKHKIRDTVEVLQYKTTMKAQKMRK